MSFNFHSPECRWFSFAAAVPSAMLTLEPATFRRISVWPSSSISPALVVTAATSACGGLSLPLMEQLLSSSIEYSSEISMSAGAFGRFSMGANGGQTLHIRRKAASRLIKLPKTCRSSAVATPTAFGMIFANFSLEIFVTDDVGMTT